MASILKATSIVGAKALKPSSGSAKHVRGKLEHLGKDYAEKSMEAASPRLKKVKETSTREWLRSFLKKEKVVLQ